MTIKHSPGESVYFVLKEPRDIQIECTECLGEGTVPRYPRENNSRAICPKCEGSEVEELALGNVWHMYKGTVAFIEVHNNNIIYIINNVDGTTPSIEFRLMNHIYQERSEALAVWTEHDNAEKLCIGKKSLDTLHKKKKQLELQLLSINEILAELSVEAL